MSSSPRRLLAIGGAVLAVGLFGAGCSSSSSSATNTGTSTTTEAPEGSTAAVTVKEFEISVDPSSGTGPEIQFNISNTGSITHEFVVFKTDLAPEALPTDADGAVDEAGEGVEHIGEVEDIAAGSTDGTLSLQLDPGNYVLICNLPDHYAGGMHTAFTVS